MLSSRSPMRATSPCIPWVFRRPCGTHRRFAALAPWRSHARRTPRSATAASSSTAAGPFDPTMPASSLTCPRAHHRQPRRHGGTLGILRPPLRKRPRQLTAPPLRSLHTAPHRLRLLTARLPFLAHHPLPALTHTDMSTSTCSETCKAARERWRKVVRTRSAPRITMALYQSRASAAASWSAHGGGSRRPA